MILILIEFLRDFALLLINTITKLLSSIQSLHQASSSNKPFNQTAHLQETRTALILQQEEISRRIAEIEDQIQSLTKSTTQDQAKNCPTTITDSPLTQTNQPIESITTPIRRRRRPTSIGKPYPLPFIPPRTPEEERRNNVISWINDIRRLHHNNHEHRE